MIRCINQPHPIIPSPLRRGENLRLNFPSPSGCAGRGGPYPIGDGVDRKWEFFNKIFEILYFSVCKLLGIFFNLTIKRRDGPVGRLILLKNIFENRICKMEFVDSIT